MKSSTIGLLLLLLLCTYSSGSVFRQLAKDKSEKLGEKAVNGVKSIKKKFSSKQQQSSSIVRLHNQTIYKSSTYAEDYCKDFGQSLLLFAYRGFCYSVTSELIPWAKADNYCQQHFRNVSNRQASLLVFDEDDSDSEFQYIKQIFMSYNQSATKLSASIGFSYRNNTWLWLDGRKVDFSETPPSIYAAKNSIFPYEQLMCGLIEFLRLPNETKFGLMQQECLTPERVFCKLEVDYCFENDKCGLNGVCSNEDGAFRCECAFLYDGAYCDQYSSEAIQVIIASILIGLACIVIAVCKKIQNGQNKSLPVDHYERTDTTAAHDHLLNLDHNKSLNKFKQIGSLCFQKFPDWIHHTPSTSSSSYDSCSKPPLPPPILRGNHEKHRRSNRHRTKTKTSDGLLTFVQSFLTVTVAGVAIVYICVRRTSSIYDYDSQTSKHHHNASISKLKDYIGLKSTNDENRTVAISNSLKKSYLCRLIGSNYVNQNVFMLPFSALLTFILFLLYQTSQQSSSPVKHHHRYRWFFQRLKFPIILNPFQKSDRFHTVILFGVISNQIINLLIEVLLKPSADVRMGILFDLIRRLGLVILCGARYFPILIGLNVHCLTSTFLTSLFITFDLALSVYCEAHCIQSVSDHLTSTVSMINSSSRIQLDIARIHYVLAKCLPHYVALAHIMARFYTLTLKHFLYLCKGNERWSHNYSKSTINTNTTNTIYNTISKEFDNDWYYTKSLMKHGSTPNYYLYTSQPQTHSKTFKQFLHKIYKPRPYFRYSLLVLFTYTVSFLVLYYLTCLLIFSSTFTLRLLMTVTGNILMKLIQISPITINIKTIKEKIKINK
ncbi:unnamed protein product [Didymodactylos carnosus]|uniref:C-type lectin domain-containing protein n=1 Tax=Didymodactylos carnosus TaxID=1234261 RepID=A0A815EFN6_9BILA|nr:unnamed protein product [Didymodactylos carnosus]CAF4148858.1 unnamed protein product [Didymodactylos carnosus]